MHQFTQCVKVFKNYLFHMLNCHGELPICIPQGDAVCNESVRKSDHQPHNNDIANNSKEKYGYLGKSDKQTDAHGHLVAAPR